MDNELKALLVLLEDTDEEIYQIVENKLLNMGLEIVPSLEKAWDNSLDNLFHQRIENIIESIQFASITKKMDNWVKSEQGDLTPVQTRHLARVVREEFK